MSHRYFSASVHAFLVLTAVCLTVIQPAYAQVDAPEPKPSRPDAAVLIFPIRTSGVELSDPAKQELVRYLGTRLTIERVYNVMPEAQIQKELGAAKIESYKDCYEESCRIELGRAIMADKSLSVDITSEKGHCRITATIYDLKKEMSESAGDTQAGCRLEDLRAGMKVIAEQLSGKGEAGQDSGSGFAGTGVTESGVVSVGITPDLGEKIVNKVTDQKGFLTVRVHRKGESNDAKAMILLNGKEFRPSPSQTEEMVGDYVVAARLDDYYHVATKKIHLGTEGATLDLELQPAFGGLTIVTDPGDAEVLINDRLVRKTSEGLSYSDKQMKLGKYRVEVRRNLYKSVKRIVTVMEGVQSNEVFKLDADFGNIDLTTEPSGVTVFLDGKEVGKTKNINKPLSLADLATGVHNLRLVKDSYLPEERQVRVGEGKVIREHFALKTDFGGLTVTSDPAGSAITLDDNLIGKETPASLSPLKPGVHFVALEKQGYGRAVEKITVVDGQNVELKVVLQPKIGILSVIGETGDGSPCEGEVFIDGKSVGRTPWKGEVLALSHNVQVKCPEGAQMRTVVVPHNGRESLTLTVGSRASLVGKADVTMDPVDRKMVKTEVSGGLKYSPWPWVTLGIGAAAVVTGGVLNVFADVDMNKVQSVQTDSSGHVIGISREEVIALETRANAKNNAAIGMYAVGSAAVLTGLIWGIVDVVNVNKARQQIRARARVSGILMPGGGGIGIAGAF